MKIRAGFNLHLKRNFLLAGFVTGEEVVVSNSKRENGREGVSFKNSFRRFFL